MWYIFFCERYYMHVAHYRLGKEPNYSVNYVWQNAIAFKIPHFIEKCDVVFHIPSHQYKMVPCYAAFHALKNWFGHTKSFQIIAIFMPKPHYFDFKPLCHADATSECIVDLCKYTAAEL